MVSDALINRSADAAARLAEQAARLSMEIESDVRSQRGPISYILACAHVETVQAFMDLATVDPNKPDEIRKLQLRIDHYAAIEMWLSKAVSEGAQAYRDLNDPGLAEEWLKTFTDNGDDA